jgi:hypothetical protein
MYEPHVVLEANQGTAPCDGAPVEGSRFRSEMWVRRGGNESDANDPEK